MAAQNSEAGRHLEVLKRNTALLAFPLGRVTLQTSRGYIYSCPLKLERRYVKSLLADSTCLSSQLSGSSGPSEPLCGQIKVAPERHSDSSEGSVTPGLCPVAALPTRLGLTQGRRTSQTAHSFRDHLRGMCDRHPASGGGVLHPELLAA